MIDKIEGWLLNVFLGKVVSRLSLVIVAYAASVPVQSLLLKAGVHVQIDQAELATGMIAASQAAFEYFKKRRAANPNSPAVQTDAKAPGAGISATALANKP